MSQYGNFAYVYDQLMDDVDYEAWVRHIEPVVQVILQYPWPKRATILRV